MPTSQDILPLDADEILYVGVDIGKYTHVAGLVSRRLLTKHNQMMRCPILTFEQSREGFQALIATIQQYVSLANCRVIMERTGHYHKALEQFLQEHAIIVYTIQVHERHRNRDKTDKADALRLGHLLYQQLEHGMHMADRRQVAKQMLPVQDNILFLQTLVRHRYELVQECTQRKNQLTAICDEVFPEFTRVFKDPNLPTALIVRQRFATPAAIAAASLDALRNTRIWRHPSNAKFVELQQLAAHTIGTKNVSRQRGLVIEQAQLIEELLLLQKHVDVLEQEICATIETMREGQILTSIPIIGPVQAATLIAVIGTIDNFTSIGALRAYLGWAPMMEQTGITFNHARLTPRGSRMARQSIYLIICNAIRRDNEWARLYHRLVPVKCTYDPRTKKYTGRTK
jgi:transposase